MTTTFDTLYGDGAADILDDVLGETVAYTPVGGEAASITGRFAQGEADLTYGDDGRGVAGQGVLSIRNDATDGVVSPAAGDSVSIGGATWYVHEVMQTSATQHRLRMVQYTRSEVHRDGLNRVRF